MPACLQVPTMPAAFPATDAEVACSTHLGPGWVLEAPQRDQPGRVTDTTITPFAFDCDADAHSVSGLTSCIDSDVPSPSANLFLSWCHRLPTTRLRRTCVI